MSRILPIHPDSISSKMDDERLRVEAEKWCKPFACRIQGCSEPRIRTDEEKFKCAEAPKYLEMCVTRVVQNMKDILNQKISWM